MSDRRFGRERRLNDEAPREAPVIRAAAGDPHQDHFVQRDPAHPVEPGDDRSHDQNQIVDLAWQGVWQECDW